MRFLNIVHESYYKKNDVKTEAKELLIELNYSMTETDDFLEIYRKLDRGDIRSV